MGKTQRRYAALHYRVRRYNRCAIDLREGSGLVTRPDGLLITGNDLPVVYCQWPGMYVQPPGRRTQWPTTHTAAGLGRITQVPATQT